MKKSRIDMSDVRIRRALAVLAVYLVALSAVFFYNQPEFISVDDFDDNDLDSYEDGDIFYIRDIVKKVEEGDGYSGSMFPHNEYLVTTEGGFEYDIDTNGRANVRPGDRIVLRIEIIKMTGREDVIINGYPEYEFLLEYNYNWAVFFIATSFLLVAMYYVWESFFPFIFLGYSALFFLFSSMNDFTLGMCLGCFGVVFFLIGFTLSLFLLENRRRSQRMGRPGPVCQSCGRPLSMYTRHRFCRECNRIR